MRQADQTSSQNPGMGLTPCHWLVLTETQKRKQERERDSYLLPDMLFIKHARQVAPPIAPRPPCALFQELRVVLQRRQDLCLWVVLDIRLPAVRHHPARYEVVVVRVQLILAKPPALIGECVRKAHVLEDLAAVCDGSSRQARDTTVDMGGGRAVEVPPFQVDSSQETPDPLRPRGRGSSSHSLACSNPSILLVVFKRRQDPAQQVGWPAHVVVCEDCNGGTDLGDGGRHLAPFVGMGHGKQTNSGFGRGHRLQHLLCLLAVRLDGHQQQFEWLVCQDRADRLEQLISAAFEGGDDNSNIL